MRSTWPVPAEVPFTVTYTELSLPTLRPRKPDMTENAALTNDAYSSGCAWIQGDYVPIREAKLPLPTRMLPGTADRTRETGLY